MTERWGDSSVDREFNAAVLLMHVCKPELRLRILVLAWSLDDWKFRNTSDVARMRQAFTKQICKTLNFRKTFVERSPIEKRAAWLERVIHRKEIQEPLTGLLAEYHFREKVDLLTSMLDLLGVEHEEGAVSNSEAIPVDEVRRAVKTMLERGVSTRDMALYLGTAALMTEPWRPSYIAALSEIWRFDLTGEADELVPEEEEEAHLPESPTTLSILDNLLIRAIVDSVSGVEGALSIDEMKDVVEETISLNSTRHQSYFHSGFLGGLISESLNYEAVEMNDGRRSWLLAGEVTAMVRKRNTAAIAERYQNARGMFDTMLRDPSGPGVRAGAYVFDALWKNGQELTAANALPPTTASALGPAFFRSALEMATASLLHHRTVEARALIDLLHAATHASSSGTIPGAAVEELQRRHGQCYRAQGLFEKAREVLRRLRESADSSLGAELMADEGLCLAELRWLDEVRVPSDEHEVGSVAAQLKKGENLFKEALSAHGPQTNARLCLGVLALLQNKNESALEHLMQALSGATSDHARLRRYRESGLYARIAFHLATAILRSYRQEFFSLACDLLRDADEFWPQAEWPEWVLRDILKVIASFDPDQGVPLIEFIAEAHPGIVDELAWDSQIAKNSDSLLRRLKTNGSDDTRPRSRRWKDNLTFFEVSRDLGADSDALEAVSRLETLAFADEDLRARLIELTERDRFFDPTLADEEVMLRRVQLMELDGHLSQAGAELIRLFHLVVSRGEDSLARDILERLSSYGLEEEVQSLSVRLPESRTETKEAADETRHLRILFIGGGEERGRPYDDRVSEEVGLVSNGQVSVDFYHDTWGKGFGSHLSHLKNRIDQYDGFVLSRLMRTLLGRDLRKLLNEREKPWISSLHLGVDSMKRAVLNVSGMIRASEGAKSLQSDNGGIKSTRA